MGLVPTFGLLYLITSRYEKVIAEEDTMKTFVVGIFLGIPVVVSHLYFVSFFTDYSQAGTLLMAAYLLALAEVMLWHIFVGFRKMKKRPDVPFILLGLVLGSVSVYIIFTSAMMFVQSDLGSDQFLAMVLFAIAMSIMRGSMAIYLSLGELKGKIMVNVIAIALILGTFNLFAFLFLGSGFIWTFAVLLSVPGLIGFYFMYPRLKVAKKA